MQRNAYKRWGLGLTAADAAHSLDAAKRRVGRRFAVQDAHQPLLEVEPAHRLAVRYGFVVLKPQDFAWEKSGGQVRRAGGRTEAADADTFAQKGRLVLGTLVGPDDGVSKRPVAPIDRNERVGLAGESDRANLQAAACFETARERIEVNSRGAFDVVIR